MTEIILLIFWALLAGSDWIQMSKTEELEKRLERVTDVTIDHMEAICNIKKDVIRLDNEVSELGD